jgi:hypothetical protein
VRRTAGLSDHHLQILDLGGDRIRRGVAALAPTAAVVAVDGEVRRQDLRQGVTGPNDRYDSAPSTKTRASPSPERSNAMVVPSRDVTLLMRSPFQLCPSTVDPGSGRDSSTGEGGGLFVQADDPQDRCAVVAGAAPAGTARVRCLPRRPRPAPKSGSRTAAVQEPAREASATNASANRIDPRQRPCSLGGARRFGSRVRRWRTADLSQASPWRWGCGRGHGRRGRAHYPAVRRSAMAQQPRFTASEVLPRLRCRRPSAGWPRRLARPRGPRPVRGWRRTAGGRTRRPPA